MAASVGRHAPVLLPGEPRLCQRSLAGHSLQGRRGDPARVNTRLFCLACGDPGGAKCAGTRTASGAGVRARSEPSFSLSELVLRRPLWPVFLRSSALQHLAAPLPGGLLCGSPLRPLKGHPGRAPGLYFSASGL